MNPLWPACWQECGRIVTRFYYRREAWFLHRRLHQATRQLGELGWQQAHFDNNDADVQGLEAAERQHARIVFDIAELKETHAAGQKAHQARASELRAEIEKAQASAQQKEDHLNRLRALLAHDREQHAELYLIESTERSVVADEAALQETRQSLFLLQQELKQAEETHLGETTRLEADLQQLNVQIRDLSRTESSLYAKIGHALADVNIAPMNQPEILTRVLALRQKSASLQMQLDTSTGESAELSWAIHVGAVALCTALLVLGVLICALGLTLLLR